MFTLVCEAMCNEYYAETLLQMKIHLNDVFVLIFLFICCVL